MQNGKKLNDDCCNFIFDKVFVSLVVKARGEKNTGMWPLE